MNKQHTEERKTFSFDRSISSNIIHAEPDKYKLLEDISFKSTKIINIGSNLSYSPLGFSKDSISINIKKFNRVLEFNSEEKLITVEAGLTLIELLNFTLKYNLWIPQLPGYPSITIGGAVAANSHGKSCAIHGTIRKSIKSILLFHKKHGWIKLSEKENKEIFDLTIGGIGLTGTIVSVTFKLKQIESHKFKTKKIETNTIEECKKMILQENENSSFIYSWNRADNIKNFGKGIIYKNYINNNSKVFRTFKEYKNNFRPFFIPVWNKYSISFINFIYFKINQLTKPEKKEDFLSVIFPFYGKESYFNFFGKKGFIESQLLIHESKFDSFISEFKNLFIKYEPTITLLSLKNMSGQQKFLRFEDNKICITFDYVNNSRNLLFMSKIDNLYEKYEILPSIIKDSRITKEIFNKTYKESSEFKKELQNFDKERIYQSEISKRLNI
jgi:decaprenylphospho-beta-D-ribofuranose 2-oxidase|tara:strand:- start:1090 stop:2415 length:1326 start_codon:yes stop_codon:yes gene_type:complete